MNRRSPLIVFLIVATFLLSSCASEKPMKAKTPDEAGILLKHALSNTSTEQIDELLITGKKGTIPKAQLEKLKEKVTAGAELRTYEILKFENGDMILAYLSRNASSGLYEIVEFKEVPDDMKALFELTNPE